MPKEEPHPQSKSITISALAASILAAGALAVLALLFLWKFELRSLSRFLLLGGGLAAGFWLVLYFIYYRKLGSPLRLDLKILLISAVASLLLSLQVTPPQASIPRYLLVIALGAAGFWLANAAFLFPLAERWKLAWEAVFKAAALACALAGLAVIFFNALSVRLYADDFTYVLKLENLGVWKAGFQFYKVWSARFTSNFLVLGFSNKPWGPLFFLVLIQLVFYLCLKRVIAKSGSKSHLSVLAGAAFLPFAVYLVMPDLYKSLYWISSSMTLLPLLVMLPVFLVLLFQLLTRSPSLPALYLLAGLALIFAISTTHEAAAVGWLGMLAAALLWHFLSRSKNHPLRNFLFSGLLGAAAGMAVLVTSPGADARIAAQEYALSQSALQLIPATLRFFFGFLQGISRPLYVYQYDLRPGWLLLAAVLGLGWLSETSLPRQAGKAALVLLLSLLASAAAFFPGAYVLGETIPFRTQLIPALFLVLGCYICGLLLPRPQNPRLKTALLLLLLQMLLIGSAVSITHLTRTIEPMRQFARDWDARDYLVRSTDELPHRLKVPWEEYEQNLGDCRRYYRTR